MLKGAGARLERALIFWMLDLHIRQGYKEFYPPWMVREEVMFASGQLPKFADNLYHDHQEDFLVGADGGSAADRYHDGRDC